MRDVIKEKIERKVEDKNILDLFAEDFCRIVERYCKYIIVSGFVAIAHGRARGTDDIDIIIERISKERFEKLHNELVKYGFECIQSDRVNTIFDYLQSNVSVRYVRKNEFLPEMEVKFAKDEIDEYQIKHRVKLDFTGIDVYFSSIEGNIAFKEELLKSEKDLEDARHLRIIYEDKIDENEILKIKKMIDKLR